MRWVEILEGMTGKEAREAIEIYHAATERLVLQLPAEAKEGAINELLSGEEISEHARTQPAAEAVRRYLGKEGGRSLRSYRTAAAHAWRARYGYLVHAGRTGEQARDQALADLAHTLEAGRQVS